VVGPETTANVSFDRCWTRADLTRAVVRFGQLTDLGRSRREAMTEAAKAFDLPVRVVYAAVEEAKKSVE
jgi:hypothetical protein